MEETEDFDHPEVPAAMPLIGCCRNVARRFVKLQVSGDDLLDRVGSFTREAGTLGCDVTALRGVGFDNRADLFAAWIIHATTKTYGRAEVAGLAEFLDGMASDGLTLADVAESARRHQAALVARVVAFRADPDRVMGRTVHL